MRMQKILKRLCATLLSLLILVGCKKKFFDVNTNPNDPEQVTVSELLPSAELAIAHVVGNNFQIYGALWSQYWTQSPSSSQYKVIEQYSPKPDEFDNPWRVLYADALQDLQDIIIKSQADGKPQYVACAKILQAYTFQLLTDNFGDIPFSEAIKAEEEKLQPKYDSQREVYVGLIKLIDEALALINTNDPLHPGNEDLFFKGDMAMWEKFGNSLKLRVCLRMSEVDPIFAQNNIQTLSGKPFLLAGEEVKIVYTSTGGNTNPLYSAIVQLGFTENLMASSTIIDTMNALGDERITAFYKPLASGAYAGIPQGAYDAGTSVSNISLPSDITGANAEPEAGTAPVKLFTDYESLFLQSEAVARGWLGSGDQEALYYSAIRANFKSYKLADTLADNYLAQSDVMYPTGGLEEKLNSIVTQKWFAMCGNQGNEAWAEWRRTGYPNFFTPSEVSLIGDGRWPARMFYPTTEITRNPNCPGQKRIFEKVWWDIKD